MSIYVIRSHKTDNVYYGSTEQTLTMRLGNHRRKYTAYLNKTQHYYTAFELMKYDDAYIELVETCKNLKERESFYIRNNDCVNKLIPDRKTKEYRHHNYQQNRDEILLNGSIKIKCECGASVRTDGMSAHKKTNKHLTFMKNHPDSKLQETHV